MNAQKAGFSAAPELPVALVVDDDIGDLELTSLALEDSRMIGKTFCAVGVEEVYDFINRKGLYEDHTEYGDLVIFLDLQMPHIDGFEALQEIRSHPSLGDVPIIVLTSEPTADRVDRAMALGADMVLSKPVDMKSVGYLLRKNGLLPENSR